METTPQIKIRRLSNQKSFGSKTKLLVGMLIVLLTCAFMSITVGAANIDIPTIYRAIIAFDGSAEHTIIHTVRIPRVLIATAVGAALAIAGALMQALTRNPLASPDILGINAGAALAVVSAVFLLHTSSLSLYTWFAFAGSVISAMLVYSLSFLTPGGATPLTLALAGAAVTAFCSSMVTGILVVNEHDFDEVRFWLAGSIAGRDMAIFLQALPYLALGLCGALLLGRQLTTLALGDEVAQGLGQRTTLIKIGTGAVVVLLAGSAVATAGPIGFIGLVIPHVIRLFIGSDYRWIIPYCALTGAIFLVLSDTIARVIINPEEAPVGVITAIIGGPFFIALVHRRIRL